MPTDASSWGGQRARQQARWAKLHPWLGESARSSRRLKRGLTLVEVLIVVALIAVLSGTVLFGSGLFKSSRRRTAAMLIVQGVRLGLTRANTTGRPVRMVFDLDNERVHLEQSSGRMLREKSEDEESPAAGAEAATEEEERAQAEAESIVEGPKAPRARFAAISEMGFTDEDGNGRDLGKGIRFRRVQTEHDSEPRTEGRAYLYFWPGGGTEHAVVQLESSEEDDGLTVVVSALTGRAKIERGEVELPKPRSDGEYSERED